jgi:hypothetical protein
MATKTIGGAFRKKLLEKLIMLGGGGKSVLGRRKIIIKNPGVA